MILLRSEDGNWELSQVGTVWLLQHPCGISLHWDGFLYCPRCQKSCPEDIYMVYKLMTMGEGKK